MVDLFVNRVYTEPVDTVRFQINYRYVIKKPYKCNEIVTTKIYSVESSSSFQLEKRGMNIKNINGC
jgi:hypothetical protein